MRARARIEFLLPSTQANLGFFGSCDRHLKSNSKTGFLPTQLGMLKQLVRMDLDHDKLSGTIPSEIAGLMRLATLNFHHNYISGTLPTDLTSLTQLSWLAGSFNAISGTIPGFNGRHGTNLSALTVLNMRSCKLSGTIPSFLPRLPFLQQLSLSKNSLSGTLPGNWASDLRTLYLFGNRLSGTLPASLSELQNLTVCPLNAAQSGFPTHVNTNQFTCPLPSLPACDVTCVAPPSPPPPTWPPASPPPMDCLDTCTLEYGYHTECWDGGPGSERSLCDSGTDCFHCAELASLEPA